MTRDEINVPPGGNGATIRISYRMSAANAHAAVNERTTNPRLAYI